MSNSIVKPLSLAVGAAFLGSVAFGAFAASSDGSQGFGASDLGQGYMLVGDEKGKEGKCGEGKCGGDKKGEEGKCGEGKCGEGKCGGDKKGEEGKCGEGKCGGDKKEEKGKEGKCGEGKCGAA